MHIIPHPADRLFNDSMLWPITLPNGLQNTATREGWNKAGVNGEIHYSSVAPWLTFEEKVMIAGCKLITGPRSWRSGGGDRKGIESCTL